MEKINNVQVEIDNDKYRVFVDGVEIKAIANLKIEKSIDCASKVTLSFFVISKQKNSRNYCPICWEIMFVITCAATFSSTSSETDANLETIPLVLLQTLLSRMLSKNLWPFQVKEKM